MAVIHPTWDLDQYMLNYSGHGQIHRLRFIAQKSQPLQADALKHAIRLIKETTFNVPLYQATVDQLRLSLDPSAPQYAPVDDPAWVDQTLRITKSTADKLEAELKNYKNNLIKESIRVSCSCRVILIVDGAYGSCRTLLQMWRL
jgi:COP9 signalosome complex subunit 1